MSSRIPEIACPIGPEIDWKECWKAYSVEAYGWSGSLAVITAYAMTTLESDDKIMIDWLNLYGSSSIGYMCYRKKVWQAFVLEVAWFGFGTYSLVNHSLED